MSKYDEWIHETEDWQYKTYPGEDWLQSIIDIMTLSLSEPYPIYTYRYFVDIWADLTIVVYDKKKENKFIGCIIGNVEEKPNKIKGYIAMLAVDKDYRNRGIGRELVRWIIKILNERYHVTEVSLETEVTNIPALRWYESFGFMRTKMFAKYYWNGNSAYKLLLYEREFEEERESENAPDKVNIRRGEKESRTESEKEKEKEC